MGGWEAEPARERSGQEGDVAAVTGEEQEEPALQAEGPEEIVHVPKVVTQRWMTQQQVELTREVPIPMTQEETVEVPPVVSPHHHHPVEAEQTVDIHVLVPHPRGEVVHVPRGIPQERVIRQTGERVVEVAVPWTQEEVVHVPKGIPRERPLGSRA